MPDCCNLCPLDIQHCVWVWVMRGMFLGGFLFEEDLVSYDNIMGLDIPVVVLVHFHLGLGLLVPAPGSDYVPSLTGRVWPQVRQDGVHLAPEQQLSWTGSRSWVWCGPEAPEVAVEVHVWVPVLGDAGVPHLLEMLHETFTGSISLWIFG